MHITWTEYQEHNRTWWKGRRVRNRWPIESGWQRWPAGKEWVITNKYLGFTLQEIDTCPTCGVGTKRSLWKVSPIELELIPEKEI